MAKCWELRGCDDEMQAECAHAVEFKDNCPTKCAFSTCHRSTYELTTDPDLILSAEVDRSVAIKDDCMFCTFFLKNAPRLIVKD